MSELAWLAVYVLVAVMLAGFNTVVARFTAPSVSSWLVFKMALAVFTTGLVLLWAAAVTFG